MPDRDGKRRVLTRRQALTGTAALGVSLALGNSGPTAASLATAPKVCILTEGRPGAPLTLSLQVVEAGSCAALEGGRVDIWHSDALGVYSGYARQATGSTEGQTFLRGTQFGGADGTVRFATIYPGWYPGRTPHIHFKVILDDKDLVTGQLYFPDTTSERIYATLSPYRERKAERNTFNANDFIFQKQGGADTRVEVEKKGGAYRATLTIGIDRARGS